MILLYLIMYIFKLYNVLDIVYWQILYNILDNTLDNIRNQNGDKL